MLEQYKADKLISDDDYYFYRGLVDIREHDYGKTIASFKNVKSTRYADVIAQIQNVLNKSATQKDMPVYYKDCLVAVVLLKNGYFSVAEKLALDATTKNEKYILPYQILSYAHFLTNSYESASTYFMKLKDLDPAHADLYTFFIGAAAYRNGRYGDSLLYLGQITAPELKTDVYRYLLLNYKAQSDDTQYIAERQKLLGQADLQKEDFYQFFYDILYTPRSE